MKRKRYSRKSSAERGYGGRWQKARAAWLKAHPLCEMCLDQGVTTAATLVDHIEPHRGDHELFWRRDNWQSLCAPCHNSHKQRMEKSGHVLGCGVNGLPLDRNHHWHGGSKTNTNSD